MARGKTFYQTSVYYIPIHVKRHVEQILTETSTYKMTVKRVMVSQRVNYNTFTSRSHWPNGVNGQYCFFPNIYDVK